MKEIITILGPTATGKTHIAALLAKKIGAEIVWSEIVSYIASQVDLISIKSLYLGRSANPTSTEDIDLIPIEKSIASASGVIVNVLA